MMAIGVAALSWLMAGELPLPQPSPRSSAKTSAPPADPGWNRIDIAAGPDGHFVLTARVEGVPVTFMVDSGATAVVLAPDAARRVGLARGRLRYDQRVQTANGVIKAAPVRLREVRIGQLAQRDVEASVIDTPMQISLLGMSFLSKLERWEVRDGKLSLYW
jgi:aspartyl protease family protein